MKVTLYPPRCYLGNHRIHHAITGAALITIGAVLIASDLQDRRRWWPDLLARA